MSDSLLTVDTEGFAQIRASFSKEVIEAQAEEAAPKAGEAAFSEMLDTFNAEQYPSGGAWPPYSPAYAAWKAANYPGKKKLRLRDSLFGSLGWLRDDDPAYVVVGAVKSPPIQADIHADRFADLPETFMERLADSYESWFNSGEWVEP